MNGECLTVSIFKAMDISPVRLLLIDDEEPSFVLLRRLLSKVPGRKFEVQWAGTYQAGFTALERQGQDVCLLDYRLGPHTGLELLAEAIARDVQTPIIILTGQNDPKIDIEATHRGASDF